jgi:hypothetical protein
MGLDVETPNKSPNMIQKLDNLFGPLQQARLCTLANSSPRFRVAKAMVQWYTHVFSNGQTVEHVNPKQRSGNPQIHG